MRSRQTREEDGELPSPYNLLGQRVVHEALRGGAWMTSGGALQSGGSAMLPSLSGLSAPLPRQSSSNLRGPAITHRPYPTRSTLS